MLEKWFKKDLDKIYREHNIAVFVDETKEGYFMLETVNEDISVFETKDDLDELKVKYEIEKEKNISKKYLIYTTTPKNKLKFIREYCETNGCIEIKYLEYYIKQKVNKQLGININLPKEELISAAKVSIGKDESYWKDLQSKGEIFDLEKELLPFLHNPKLFLEKYDKDTREIFFKKINELLKQPYVPKPPETLATEVVNHLLEGLKEGKPNKILYEVYKLWLDSITSRKSFEKYLKKYNLKTLDDPFGVHPSHPFRKVDKIWLKEIGKNINNESFIKEVLPEIKKRSVNKIALSLEITFWKHVKALLDFDVNKISKLSSLEECAEFYKSEFYKIDGAIRKLYSEFLNERSLIEPYQLYYKNLSVIFLDKWFKYASADYNENQKGKIQEILENNTDKTAIVVGDAVAYEFAQDIVSVLNDRAYKLKTDFLYAGLPSETSHNMTRLYAGIDEVVAVKQERENLLKKANEDKDLGFTDLDKVNELTDKHHYLICSCKDPDKLGETFGQKALKHFDKVAEVYAEKIDQLLKNGYKNVYLLTDHGYTLTGILDEADKIDVEFTGTVEKNERYVWSVDKQDIDSDLLIEKEIKYNKYNYCYFSKRLAPFKTPGIYGFSHGGMSPQEVIVPLFRWSIDTGMQGGLLNVIIVNKNELKNVTGNLFSLKISSSGEQNNLFASERKVVLMFFVNGKKINESDIITIHNNETIKKEYSFGHNQKVEVKLMDANTKEQLDKATVIQNQARDLGGLM